jgi:hypothetical protein
MSGKSAWTFLSPLLVSRSTPWGLASEEGDQGEDLPGSRRVSQSRLTILAQSSALSMSATKVGGVGVAAWPDWVFFLDFWLFLFAPGPGILVRVVGARLRVYALPLNHRTSAWSSTFDVLIGAFIDIVVRRPPATAHACDSEAVKNIHLSYPSATDRVYTFFQSQKARRPELAS